MSEFVICFVLRSQEPHLHLHAQNVIVSLPLSIFVNCEHEHPPKPKAKAAGVSVGIIFVVGRAGKCKMEPSLPLHHKNIYCFSAGRVLLKVSLVWCPSCPRSSLPYLYLPSCSISNTTCTPAISSCSPCAAINTQGLSFDFTKCN